MGCGCGKQMCGGGCGSKKCPCTLVDCEGRPVPGSGTECDPYVVGSCEPQKATKVYDNDNCTWTVVHGDGSPPVIIDVAACAGGSGDPTETVTTLTSNADGTVYTYTSEDGTVTVIDTCNCEDVVTTLVYDPVADEYTYTSEDSTQTTFSVAGGTDSLVMTAPGVWTHTAVDGTIEIIDVCAAVAANCPFSETVTTLTFDPVTNSFSYTSEDGTVTTVSVGGNETVTTLTHDAVANEFTYVSEDGTTTTVPYCCDDVVTTFVHDPIANTITYTSEDSTVTVVNLGDIVTTLTHDAVANEFTYVSEDGTSTTVSYCCDDTVTTFVHDTVANTITYTSEDGTITVVPLAPETLTTLTSPSCGVLTYTGEDGIPNSVSYANAGLSGATVVEDTTAGNVTITDACGNAVVVPINVIDADINNVTVSGSVITFTNEDGTTIDVDVCAIVSANCASGNTETVTSLAAGAVCGTLTYNDEDGIANTIALPGLLTGVTVTDNDDGTAVLTDSCGTAITIPVSAPSVANGGAAPGNPPDPDAPSISYDETTGNITHVWDVTNQVWVPAPSGCCDVIWDETSGTTPPLPPSNTQAPAEAYDETTGNITHVWNVSTQSWVPAPSGCCDVIWDETSGTTPPLPPSNTQGPAEAYDEDTGNITHVWNVTTQTWTPAPGGCCPEIGLVPPPVPTVDPNGENWSYYEGVDIGGTTYITNEYVIDPVNGTTHKVMCCKAKDVIYCGSADATTSTPAAGDLVPAVFSQGDGIIESACATGMDTGLDGTVILDLYVDGAATGQSITINPAGAGVPFAECLDITDIPLTGAGPHTVSWAVNGGTATTGTADGVTVEFSGKCA